MVVVEEFNKVLLREYVSIDRPVRKWKGTAFV